MCVCVSFVIIVCTLQNLRMPGYTGESRAQSTLLDWQNQRWELMATVLAIMIQLLGICMLLACGPQTQFESL